MDKKKTPAIRFEGFTDDWEQRKLGELAKFSKGKGYTKGDLIEEGLPIILYGRLYTNYQTRITDVDTYVAKRENSVLSEGGEVIVPSSGETSEDIARAAVVHNKGVILGGDLNIIKPFKEIDSSFLALTISNSESQKELMKKAQGNSVVHLYNSDLKEVKLFYPNFEEQTQISNLFTHLDETITLQERQLELLKEQKKGFLQKMFPKENEKVPELRFEGFTDDWEQRKFESLLEIKDGVRRGPFGSALKKEYFVDSSDYVVYEQQNAIYDNYETRYKITKEKYNELIKFTLLEGDFIMSGAGTIGRISRVPKGIKNGVFNQALIRFRINADITDSEFFIQFIRADKMQKNLTGANPGSAITNLVPMSEVKKWKILVPNKEEQTKIGNFFKQLDKTITLQERQLQKMKEMKTAFLQKMFI